MKKETCHGREPKASHPTREPRARQMGCRVGVTDKRAVLVSENIQRDLWQ